MFPNASRWRCWAMKLAFEMEMGGLFSTMKTAGVTLVQCNRFSHMYRFEAIRFIGFKFISYSPTDICKLPDLTKWAHLTLFQNWNAGLISKIQKASILTTKINKSFSMKYNSHEFPENVIFILFQHSILNKVYNILYIWYDSSLFQNRFLNCCTFGSFFVNLGNCRKIVS